MQAAERQAVRLADGSRAWVDRTELDAATLSGIVAREHSPVRVYKDDRRSRVLAVAHGTAGAFVLKRYRLGLLKAWAYGLVRATPGWREWTGAWLLSRAGLRAAVPVALVPQGSEELIIYRLYEGRTLDELASGEQLTAKQRRAVAMAVGRQVAQMTAAGLVFRDYKPSNLLADDRTLAGDEPIMLDALGVRRARGVRGAHDMLHVMARSVQRVGRLQAGDVVSCCRAAVLGCPGLATDWKALARQVSRQVRARPRSYG